MAARLELERGAARLRLHIDPGRVEDPFEAPPRVSVLHGRPGSRPREQRLELDWSDPDTLLATLDLVGEEVALATLALPGGGSLEMPPVRLPYSPELAPAEPGSGHRELEALARRTGGRQRFDVAGLWRDQPRRPRRVELTPWLLLAAVLVFLLEIFERRTGWLSVLSARRRARGARQLEESSAALSEEPRSQAATPSAAPARSPAGDRAEEPGPPESETAPDGPTRPEADAPQPAAGVGSALAQARARARRRRR